MHAFDRMIGDLWAGGGEGGGGGGGGELVEDDGTFPAFAVVSVVVVDIFKLVGDEVATVEFSLTPSDGAAGLQPSKAGIGYR